MADPAPRAESRGGRARRRHRAILVGNRTSGGDDPNRGTAAGGAFGGTWSGPQFVLTHRPPHARAPGVTFVPDLASGLDAALAAAAGRYVNVLGADVARQCLQAGRLDEVLAIVAPVLLGDGTRLLDLPRGTEVRLEPLRVTALPHATNLWMRVVG